MFIKYFYDDKLAQASYMLACPGSGTAIVIDPARDIRPFLQAAEQHDLRIKLVTETHIHADFISGIRELSHATGAMMILSDEGDADWKYQFADDTIRLVKEGDIVMVGAVKLDIIHTPGHTPEHISFVVTDNGMNQPMGIFTGDFLFVGDVGRPDLLEEAAGQIGTREIGARQQFANIQRFKQMPDYLQILPGHGAGSACGKALGAVPSTTLGYEKLFNPAFQFDDEDDFVNWLLEGQPEAPRYFAQMKKVNKEGATLLSELSAPQYLSEQHNGKLVPDKNALVIDTRSGTSFADKHVSGSINIPFSSDSFATYLGWYVNYDEPIYLIVEQNKLDDVLCALRAVGVDKVAGYFTPEVVNHYTGTIQQMSPQEVHKTGMKILDVRGIGEYISEHIPDVKHIHMGKVPYHLDEIPRDEQIAVHCGGGLRSQIVVSILQKYGYANVINMTGGIDAWKEAHLPLEQN